MHPGERPLLLVRSGGAAALPEWQAAFAEVLPEMEVHGWDEQGIDPSRVEYALVWEPESGRLASYPNLRAIFSTAAGVDHITRDPTVPPHLPIIRMRADEMAQTVGEYVCMAVLMILRDLPRMMRAQQAGVWDQFYPARTARTTRVGIMGMGRIGLTAASMLHGIGFPVSGWTRTRHSPKAMHCYAGMTELDAFLANTDILVGLLPDTSETRGLLNAARLARLPRGAGLVNVGCGTLVVGSDLLAALDVGHLSFAVLDVFEAEPLPSVDPLWQHPRVTISAHLAGFASRQARAQSVARSIRQMSAGTLPDALYDRSRGY